MPAAEPAMRGLAAHAKAAVSAFAALAAAAPAAPFAPAEPCSADVYAAAVGSA